MTSHKDTHKLVKEAYASIARQRSSCCGAKAPCCEEAQAVPEAELGLSCGDPVAFSHLRPGDAVADLGSGGGKDVFLAAQAVGPTGRAIGIDMTPEMIALARRNARKFRKATGLDNVEFRKGLIEALPIEDASVDVVISNCVINLSPDKPQVFREIHRVLRPGGRMVVSDLVLNRELPDAVRNSEKFYAACIAGALLREDYLRAIRAAGFGSIEVLNDRLYSAGNACDDPVTSQVAGLLEGIASSVTLMAVK